MQHNAILPGAELMKHGKCKLCLLDKPLCESHLMPRALYDHCGDIPIRVGDGIVMPTNRHLKAHLLCRGCEDILGDGGEKWICPKLIWSDRKFELFDRLPTPEWADANGAIYYVARNPRISVGEITHFAVGIFCKAGVHSWKGKATAPLIDLGPYEPVLRDWLRGESALPNSIVLTFTISRPARAQITFNWPVENPRRAWRTYTFHALGANFVLRAGNGMPWQMVDTCFYHNPVHPILVSDELSGIIEERQMEQFMGSRKTRAFEQSWKQKK
jgi:hypothetical protein